MSGIALPKKLLIFISCSTSDIEIARYFKSALDQLPGFRGFIARDEPRTFEYPSEKIADILENCRAFIILYTQQGIESPMVNQEFGFYYHRYRGLRGKNPPILLVKSESIIDQIDGFAYGRESIPLDIKDPKYAISRVLWDLQYAYSIRFVEIKCGSHYSRLQWPSLDLCQDCINSNKIIEFPCHICGEKIEVDPYAFIRV